MCGLLDRMVNSSGDKEAGEWSKMGPHDEFLELCAVSTSGDLTEEEQNKLNAHLAGCADCRQALKEFEAAVDVGVPLLASKLSTVPSEESESPRKELAGRPLSKSAASGSRQSRSRGFGRRRKEGICVRSKEWYLDGRR